MSEFGEKLQAATGKVEFFSGPEGVQMRISGTQIRALYQIAVGYDGRALAVVPMRGLGAAPPPYPQPSMLAWIQSDEQGLWGRQCSNCESYFRTGHIAGVTICPSVFLGA
jgi:hypothetical protein